MTDEQKIVISSNEEKNFDKQIRPNLFDDFIGQASIVKSLKTYITAAKQRGEALDHILLYGPPGLGKTTLSNIIATELEKGFLSTSGPVISIPGDLSGMLTNLQDRDVFFIDEIHTLVGAGGGQGAMDAANILKPALARGELRAIGATTLDEYQKYFEKVWTACPRTRNVVES